MINRNVYKGEYDYDHSCDCCGNTVYAYMKCCSKCKEDDIFAEFNSEDFIKGKQVVETACLNCDQEYRLTIFEKKRRK